MGIVRYWKDETVLERAITICESLAVRHRTEFALLGLWYCGYEVDITKARKAWLASLRRTQISFLGKAITVEGKEDALCILAERLSEGREGVERLLIEVLNALFNPASAMEVDEELVSATKLLLKIKDGISTGALYKSTHIQKVLKYVREQLSIDARQNLIASSTNEELWDAHSRWCKATLAISSMCVLDFNEYHEEMLLIGRRLKLTFGSHFIFAMLLAAKEGYGLQIDEFIDQAERSKAAIN